MNPDHPRIQKEDFGPILEKERRKCNMGEGSELNGEGEEREEGRKKWRRIIQIPQGDGHCKTPRASRSNQVHLPPPPLLQEDGAPRGTQKQPPWESHICGGDREAPSP